MKKTFWMVMLVLSLCLSLGSCGSCAVGVVKDVDGDGRESAQTLTATVLGFRRDTECQYEDDHGDWSCNYLVGTLVGPWDKSPNDGARPVATFIARWIPVPMEWFICFILLSHSLEHRPPPAKKKGEEEKERK